MQNLIKKYDVPTPRYTSYPTVPFWQGITPNEWVDSIQACVNDYSQAVMDISLYIHVPYCRSLCAFCGCTKVITRDASRSEPFVSAAIREFELKLEAYSKHGKIFQLKELHLGGGTPTWLSPDYLDTLLTGVLTKVPSENCDISIEVDPRTFTPEHSEVLQKHKVSRVSLGVQDFNTETLKAIKRIQPYETVATAVDILRSINIQSVNFDLVYGLPYQTKETMASTIDLVLGLKPSRIALYSYAHVPQIKPAQKGVEMHGLPSAVDKRALYEVARNALVKNGYIEIGMDHFALPNDALYLALCEKRLHRNFMGYTIQDTKLLLGLGPSSLSDSWFAFSQNEKNVDLWLARIQKGDIDPIGGHQLSQEDRHKRKKILDLMCNFQTSLEHQDWLDIKDSEVVSDGLVVWDDSKKILTATDCGKTFIRNICSQFDSYLPKKQNDTPIFSKGI